MAGNADCKTRQSLMKNDNHLRSLKNSSASSQLLQAANNGRHTEVSHLLESSLDQISKKMLDTAVFNASANGHKRLMQLFIKHGINVNGKNTKGQTALMAAAEHGYLDIVKLLVKNGADVNCKTKGGKTALMLAAEKACSVPVIEFLISNKCRADVNIQDREGKTALMMSIQLCDIAAMRVLMYHKETDLDLQDRKSRTALDIAKQNGVHEEFFCLLECVGNHFLNPLMLTVMRGNLRSLKEFLDDDYYNIEETNDHGYTSLILALKNMSHDCQHGNSSKDIVLTLIKSGADVSKLCSGQSECTPLLYAASLGNLEAVKLLVEHGANINAQTPTSKLTALIVTAQRGFCNIMEFLLKNGADFSLKDHSGTTALTSALENGEITCTDMLLQHGAEIAGEDLKLAACMDIDSDKYLQFPSVTKVIAASNMCSILITRCFSSKSYALVKFLLDNGADINKHLNNLLSAAVTSDACMAKLLLERGAKLNEVDAFGRTALMKAVCNDNGAAVQLLIERGADMNLDCDGKTALTFAITEQVKTALKSLLHGGVDVNYVPQHPSSSTPLHLSISLGCNEVTELLISQGADINCLDKTYQTPLMLAINLHNYDVIKLLIAKGADCDKQTFEGRTALHIALSKQEVRAVEVLIRAGADVNVSDNKGTTALIICSQVCTTDVMLLLLKSGADVNAADESGYTALLYAVKHSILLTDKAEMLIKYGADINKADNDGQTAFIVASRFCKDGMLRLLLEHGANLNAQDRFGSTALIHTLHIKDKKAEFLINLGADVNIQDNWGCTALMEAANTCNVLAMKALISAGADVHAVERRTNCNVFSLLLSRYNVCNLCFGEECKHYLCMEILVNSGARPTLSNHCVLALYKAVVCNNLKLVQLLVGCGIPPLEMPRGRQDILHCSFPQKFFTAMCGYPSGNSLDWEEYLAAINTSVHARSPLSTAIFCKNAGICHFFIKNWYFNENDMNKRSLYMFHDLIANAKGTKLATVCEEIFFQPWSLATMSFVAVSACVNRYQDREKRIKALPIPHILQEQLLYMISDSNLPAVISKNDEVVRFELNHQHLLGLNYMD